MKILNSISNPADFHPGLYRIMRVEYFTDASKFPVALVKYKKDVLVTASKENAFYVSMKTLYNCSLSEILDVTLLPKSLEGKTINVKSVNQIPVVNNNKLALIQEVQWEILNKFTMYDLYKQQGKLGLVVPVAEYNEYEELERNLDNESKNIEDGYTDVSNEDQYPEH